MKKALKLSDKWINISFHAWKWDWAVRGIEGSEIEILFDKVGDDNFRNDGAIQSYKKKDVVMCGLRCCGLWLKAVGTRARCTVEWVDQ